MLCVDRSVVPLSRESSRAIAEVVRNDWTDKQKTLNRHNGQRAIQNEPM